MERLTISDKPIEGGIRRAVVDARAVKEQALTLYWALKKYEDTGLTPEEIMDGLMLTGWILVEERLPDEPGNYWVTMRHLDGSVTTEKMFWRPDWPHEAAWNEVVVAWQPYYCPEPYQKEEEG